MTIISFIVFIDHGFILWQFLCVYDVLIMFWQLLKLFDQICHGKLCVVGTYSLHFDNLWIHHNNWVPFGRKMPTTLKIVILLGLQRHNMLKIMTDKSSFNLKICINPIKMFSNIIKNLLLITLWWKCFWLIHTHQIYFKVCQMFP